MTFNRNQLNRSLPLSLLDYVSGDPDAVTDWADALEECLADAIALNRAISVPARIYEFSRPVIVPDDWSGIWINGEAQGSASLTDCIGSRFRFPNCDGLRVYWKTAVHEQFQVQNITFENSDNDGAAVPTYDKSNSPHAIKHIIDSGRTFPGNYNYPQMIMYKNLSVAGFSRGLSYTRAAGYNDPASFFGTHIIDGIHTYQTDYFFRADATYFNLWAARNIRAHVGGWLDINGAGGLWHFEDVHAEAAATRILISQFSLENEFHFLGQGGEYNGTPISFTNSNGTINAGGTDGFIKLGAGTHTRTYKVYLYGQQRVPGNFELPPEFGRFIELWNYGTPIEILPNGCIIHTPETIKVTPDVWTSAADPAKVRTFKVPYSVYGGAGTNRTACTQAIAGKPTGTNAGVTAQVTGRYPWIEAVPTEANFFGNSIPRSPAVTGTDQMFVMSYVGQMESGLSKFSSPADINISGTQTLVFGDAHIADTGLYCEVIMTRIDSSATLDTFYTLPVDVDLLSVGYGSWHAVQDAPTNQPLAVPRYTFGVTALELLHPAGHEVPLCLTVAGSATTTVNLRTANSVSAACEVSVSTATGAKGVFVGGGVTGSAANKTQASLANINTATSITLAVVDGDDPDMLAVTIANASATPTTANVKIKVG